MIYMDPSQKIVLAWWCGGSTFKFLQSNAGRRDSGKIMCRWKNAFTNNRPGPGGVVYIQQMLVDNNKWVITKAKENPRLKTNKRQMP